jgi:hypothetical protein
VPGTIVIAACGVTSIGTIVIACETGAAMGTTTDAAIGREIIGVDTGGGTDAIASGPLDTLRPG